MKGDIIIGGENKLKKQGQPKAIVRKVFEGPEWASQSIGCERQTESQQNQARDDNLKNQQIH